MYEISLLLESKDVPASNGATFDRLNPITGDVASRAAAAQIADAKRAADAAAAAFPAWSATGPNARRAILLKAADLLASKAPQFIELMAAETGATAGWAGFNVHLAAGMLREAAAMTTQISGEVIPSDKPGCIAMAVRQPAGVVLEHRAVERAGHPRRARHRDAAGLRQHRGAEGLRNLPGHPPADRASACATPACRRASSTSSPTRRKMPPALIETLIGHPAVRRVNFTGSTRVGRIIAQVAAKYLKPVLLELGGKAPLIVLDDADLDAAVEAAAFGAFMNQGQICMSTERIVVDEKVADAFVDQARGEGRHRWPPAIRARAMSPLGSLIGTDAAAAHPGA